VFGTPGYVENSGKSTEDTLKKVGDLLFTICCFLAIRPIFLQKDLAYNAPPMYWSRLSL